MELVGILSKGERSTFPQNSQSFHTTSGATDRQSGGKLATPKGWWQMANVVAHRSRS